MKMISALSLTGLLVFTSASQAGVIVGGTRLIYDANKKESSLNVNNPDKIPYLIQSWVETASGVKEKIPFIVTPPLFRLNGGQDNVLRVVRTGENLPADKESLYWMNIKSIPAVNKDISQNTLQIAVKTRIKLIYRPSAVKGTSEDGAAKLTWRRESSVLHVFNPTPYYMNFQEVKIGNTPVPDVTFVAPGQSVTFPLPANAKGGNIYWKLINDYGGIGKEHQGKL